MLDKQNSSLQVANTYCRKGLQDSFLYMMVHSIIEFFGGFKDFEQSTRSQEWLVRASGPMPGQFIQGQIMWYWRPGWVFGTCHRWLCVFGEDLHYNHAWNFITQSVLLDSLHMLLQFPWPLVRLLFYAYQIRGISKRRSTTMLTDDLYGSPSDDVSDDIVKTAWFSHLIDKQAVASTILELLDIWRSRLPPSLLCGPWLAKPFECCHAWKGRLHLRKSVCQIAEHGWGPSR